MKGHFKIANGIPRNGTPANIFASALIGPAGGEISIPDAGLRISIPAGALASDSSFSVTAHPSIHGFNVTMTPPQTLAKRARVEQRVAEHHISAQHTDPPFLVALTDQIQAQAECSKFFAGRVEHGAVVAHLPHFSGYILAGGNGFEPCDPADGDPNCVWVDDGE